ncbi:hypothetical protein CRUP_017976 [Coryphaenoides rupestris]|nr:hypothetical protein CRUP_017976 [Coryphaenoides rupestris]
MLGGAVLIILHAPRCRALPPSHWWNQGPLYQIGDVGAFSQNLAGLQQKLPQLSKLKLKGLVLGPLHLAPADQPQHLDFLNISPDVGNLQQFKDLLQAVHKKNMHLVLDLTPNYRGDQPWFSNISVTTVAEELKSALMFWLSVGVDGVQLAGVEQVSSLVPSLWDDIRSIVQNHSDHLTSKNGVDLLLSNLLSSSPNTSEHAQSVQALYSAHPQSRLAWNLGGRSQGHLASLVGAAGVKVHLLLLFMLPGTPVFNYGDEIGLMDQEQEEEQTSCLQVFRTLADLRERELALQYGDLLLLLPNSSSSSWLGLGRSWDQSERYVAAFNWADQGVSLDLSHPLLGPRGLVVLDTAGTPGTSGTTVTLGALELGPAQALLLKVPYHQG